MNELIKVNYDSDRPTVLGRDLHNFLEVETPYRVWFPRMCEYGFVDGIDYTPYIFVHPQNNQKTKDHQLTIEMAKELCMLQRTGKGKQARQYFINLEKAWNTPEMVMARALKMSQQKIESMQSELFQKDQIIGELKPKADYTDKILQSKDLVTITQIAKDYGMSGNEMNKLLHNLKIQYKLNDQWLLYANHQGKGYTHSETVQISSHWGQRVGVKMITKWTQKGRLFLYEKLKKNHVLPMIERENQLELI